MVSEQRSPPKGRKTGALPNGLGHHWVSGACLKFLDTDTLAAEEHMGRVQQFGS